MQSLKSLFALGVWLSVQTGCMAGSVPSGGSCGTILPAEVSSFGYTPTNGPLNWFKTVPGSGLCKTGKNQSPILLDSSIPTIAAGRLVFTPGLSTGTVKLENIGTAVEVLQANASLSTGDGNAYTLRNYHFHTPSEHRINLEHAPIELHIVFADGAGNRAVLGFLIELLAKSKDSSKFLSKTLSKVNCISDPGTAINIPLPPLDEIADFVSKTSFYRYSGSLTTPPCSEPVNWFVSTKKLLLDVDTYNALKKVIKFNSRFTQSAPGQTNVLQDACTLV